MRFDISKSSVCIVAWMLKKKSGGGVGYTGGLVSWDHGRCSPRLTCVNTVACLNLPCYPLSSIAFRHLPFSRWFSSAWLRLSLLLVAERAASVKESISDERALCQSETKHRGCVL